MAKRFGSSPEEHRTQAIKAVQVKRQHARRLKQALKSRTPNCRQALQSLIGLERQDQAKWSEARGANIRVRGEERMMGKLHAEFSRKCLVNQKVR